MAVEAIAINYNSGNGLWQWSHTATDSTVTTGEFQAQNTAYTQAQRAFPYFPVRSITIGTGPTAKPSFAWDAPAANDQPYYDATTNTWKSAQSSATEIAAALASPVITGTMTLSQGSNVVLNTTTGSQLGTATNQLLGFWGATAIVRPAAYTQTYSTAARTVPNATVGAVSTAGVGLTAYGFSQAQGDSIPVAINALTADVLALRQLVNALIDDHQAMGLSG